MKGWRSRLLPKGKSGYNRIVVELEIGSAFILGNNQALGTKYSRWLTGKAVHGKL
jgi:hypothetical protein